MATNGTLKYKQDDGSIVELNPVGVDNTARTRLNAQATQIHCIEQTTGYTADLAEVPATSMKESIDALSTKVKNLEKNLPKTFAIEFGKGCNFTLGATSTTSMISDIPIPYFPGYSMTLDTTSGHFADSAYFAIVNHSMMTMDSSAFSYNYEILDSHDGSDYSPFVRITMTTTAALPANVLHIFSTSVTAYGRVIYTKF